MDENYFIAALLSFFYMEFVIIKFVLSLICKNKFVPQSSRGTNVQGYYEAEIYYY